MAGTIAPTPFVGRAEELRTLREAMASAGAGGARVVLVEGPAGIGKSALLRELIRSADGTRLLHASGAELEATVPWGIVEQLVGAAGIDAERVPPVLAPPGPDTPTVGAGLVRLLGTVQAGQPLTIVVDDAHWADVASLQSLMFAVRRLGRDPVLAVLVVREEERERLPEALLGMAEGPRGGRVRLGGLDTSDLGELAAALGVTVSDRAAERLWEHTGGNPLHVRTLLEELEPEEIEAAHEAPLPAPRSFSQLVVNRLGHCPVASQQLAAAAAVLGPIAPLDLAGRLAEVDDPLTALETLAASEVASSRRVGVRIEIVFAHELVRAAIYHDLGPARVAALHRRVADLVDDERTGLHHLAAAAHGHDPDLAAVVAGFARREWARGAWTSAAESFGRAARLAPDPQERDTLLLEAVEAALLAGDGRTVERLVGELDPQLDSARRRYMMGRLAIVTSTWTGAAELIQSAWEACDPVTDPELAARIAGQAGMIAANDGHGAAALTWSRRALALSPEPPPDAMFLLLLTLYITGREDEAAAVLAVLPPRLREVPLEHTDSLLARGILRLWTSDLDGAVSDLTAVHRACARRGPFHTGHIALFYLADAQYRTGHWNAATTSAQTAVSATTDADQLWFAGFTHAAAAFPLAARGDWAAAVEHVESAGAGAKARGDMAARVWAATAAARLAQARGDARAMLDAVEPIGDYLDRDGGNDPGMQPWALLWCEALIGLDRLQKAAELLERLEDGEQRPSLLMDLARLQGMLRSAGGDRDAATEAFRTGLIHADVADLPFARAQLEMALGAHLRRAGRRSAAGDLLTAAHHRFTALAARPYLERCERELAACGLAAHRNEHDAPAQLTPQELAVAHLVASGATNRETAAELVVSIKAVEFHLGNIYRKLGIRSRTQLAIRMRAAPQLGA